MSTVCGRPQGGGGPAHVDACGQGGGGSKTLFFCGRHKWMAPKTKSTESSCKQPHSGSLTLNPIIILCGTNCTRWITIYTSASPTERIHKTYWNNKKVLALRMSTRSFTPHLSTSLSRLCGRPL